MEKIEEQNLNENDNKLLAFCMDKRRSVNQIAEFLNIKPSSVSTRIYKKLLPLKLINVERGGKGKKTFVRTKKGDKTTEHFVTILKEIKRKGEVSEREYANILPFNPFDITEQDRFNATMTLRFQFPELIENVIRITPEGEKFLKENDPSK